MALLEKVDTARADAFYKLRGDAKKKSKGNALGQKYCRKKMKNCNHFFSYLTHVFFFFFI